MELRSTVFVFALATLVAACGGGGASTSPNTANTSPVAGSSGITTAALSPNGNVNPNTGNVINTPNSSSSTASGSLSSSRSSSSTSSINTSIVWTSVAPAPGKVNIVSPDTNIADGTIITFGQAFPAGEVSSGQYVQASVGGTSLPTQTDVKRRHPDGSIRHAIVSVRLPSVTSSPQATIALSLGTTASATSGTGVTLASVNAGGSPVDYRVEIVEHGLKKDGTATSESGQTWTTTLKSALSGSVDQWIGGPLTSEWRARVAPVSGSAVPHPGLRVIFDARYQSTTQGRVSIAIENVESNTGRGDRTYDLRIYNATTGGTVVYSKDNLLHYASTRFRNVFYFGTGMKQLIAVADAARLKNARAIPNYASITIPESTLASNYSSWLSSNRGLYQPARITPGMTNTGGRWDIGPLPGWTATALVSGDPRMYQIMLDHADRAGMWNVHWRDSLLAGATAATADIFSLDNHPNFTLFNSSSDPASYAGSTHVNWMGDSLPAPSLPFSVPAGWQHDTDHEPSFAYLPYVVTGDRFYLDELYFYANWHAIYRNPAYRGNGDGLLYNYQVRGQAWSMRTLGHAAWIAPDAHWQKAYFTNKLNKNIAWYRVNIVPTNALGYWTSAVDWRVDLVPNSSGLVGKVIAPWQHHFMAYTLAELCDRGFAATDVRDFALGFSTRLFTSDPDFNHFDGTTYYLPSQLTDGSYINTMAALSHHAFATRATGAPTELAGYNSPDGYAIQGLAALSTSIDASVANANVGYLFVRGEIMRYGNSNRLLFVNNPTWNIVPRNAVVGLGEAPGIYTK